MASLMAANANQPNAKLQGILFRFGKVEHSI
jgi:hypothetical protein